VYDATAVTALLRVMALRSAPPAELIERLAPEHASGARRREARGAGPGIPRAAVGSSGRALPADRAAPGPGAWL
jgi:hypothetical protein